MNRPGSGIGDDSTLPLLAAFVVALAFLGAVVAIGLSGGSAESVAVTPTETAFVPEVEVQPRVKLTLGTAGAGTGTVRVAGESRVCSNECSFTLDRETSVTIIARAKPGSKFVSWTGSCGRGRICTIYLDSSRSATALFTVPTAVTSLPDCNDTTDNDADGFTDDADPECFIGPTESGEDPNVIAPPDETTTRPPPPIAPPPPPVVAPPVVRPPPAVPPPPVAPPPVAPPPVAPPPVAPPPVAPEPAAPPPPATR